jgi:hypothetical protein
MCRPMHASPIWKAAYDGDVERMQQLVSDSADYHMGPRDQCTVLHVAAWRGHTHVVNMLLADAKWAASGSRDGSRDGYGGGSPVPHPSVNIADRYGLYPLHYAMRGLHVDIAETLIAHGADADSNLCPNFIKKKKNLGSLRTKRTGQRPPCYLHPARCGRPILQTSTAKMFRPQKRSGGTDGLK